MKEKLYKILNSLLSKKVIFPYLLLIVFIVVPYMVRHGQYLAGSDTSFYEFASRFNLERSFYYWRPLNGVGGESFQGSGSLLFVWFIAFLTKISSPLFAQVCTKIVFYSLGFWAVFLLLREYCKKNEYVFKGFLAALISFFYCTNLLGFDLIRTWLNLYYVFFLLTPVLVLLYIKTILSERKRYFIIFLGVVAVNQVCFSNVSYPAIQYLTLIIFSFIFLERRHLRKSLKILALLTLLNVNSIIDNILAVTNQRSSLFLNTVNAQLINDAPLAQKKYYSILNILSFTSGRLLEGTRWTVEGSRSIFSWSKYYMNPFVRIISLIPIFTIITSLFQKGAKRKFLLTHLAFLMSLVLISMFGYPLFESAFNALFEKVPLLWVFRNSLKFSVPALMVACLLLYASIQRSRWISYLFMGYLAVTSLYGFVGAFADRYSFTYIPKPYQQLDESLIKLDHDSGDRIMAFPAYGNLWLVYNFGYMGFHPLVTFQNTFPSFTTDAYGSGSISNRIYEELSSLDEGSLARFKKYSIKYIMLNHDLSFAAYNIDKHVYEESEAYLESHFSKIEENDNYSLFRVYEQNTPIIASNEITYERISPVEYKVVLKNVTSTRNVTLNQAYSNGWSVYVNQLDSDSVGDNQAGKGSFSALKSLSYGLRDSDFWWSHTLANDYGNTWSIDPVYIKTTYKPNYYITNLDGSIDIILTVFFRPQVYYYLGLIAAASVFVFSLMGLLFIGITKNKNG